MKDIKLVKLAALNSLGVLVYVFLVSLFMNNAEKVFGKVDNKFFAPVIFLLLFILSALTTGFLILGKPLMLYLDGAKKEAVKLLFYTGSSIFIILIILGVGLFLFK
jgi:hypothetical protein